MPIEWTASSATRTVEAVGTGKVTAADCRDFIHATGKAGVRGYAKLVDLSRARAEISASEIEVIATAINRIADQDGERLGPVAFVVDSSTALERLMQLDDRTATSLWPMAVFPSRQAAVDWLEEMRPR